MSSSAEIRAGGERGDRIPVWVSVGLGLAGLAVAAYWPEGWGVLGLGCGVLSLLLLVLSVRRQRRTCEALRRSHQEAIAEQRAFVATVSHDLRTPLTAVLGFTQLLTEDAGLLSPERAGTYLRMVKEQAEQLARLIEDTVDLARLREGTLGLRQVECTVSDLVASAFILFPAPSLRERVMVRVDPDTPALWCDQHEGEQILDRLFQVALAQADPAQPIILEAAPDGRAVRLTVRAAGLDPAHGAFRPFAGDLRAAMLLGQRQKGCLWAAATRALVELHGGRIWIDERGPAICLTLPAAAQPAVELSSLATQVA